MGLFNSRKEDEAPMPPAPDASAPPVPAAPPMPSAAPAPGVPEAPSGEVQVPDFPSSASLSPPPIPGGSLDDIKQQVVGEGFDNSAPLSNQWLKISDFPNGVLFSLNKNNETAQSGDSNQMIFSFNKIISYLSRFITLKKGDLIFTGTPAGVGEVNIGDTLTAFVGDQNVLKVNIK